MNKNTSLKTAIQLQEANFSSGIEAEQCVEALATQEGMVGVRVMPPSTVKPGYRVLGYMVDEGIADAALATISARRVVLMGVNDMRWIGGGAK